MTLWWLGFGRASIIPLLNSEETRTSPFYRILAESENQTVMRRSIQSCYETAFDGHPPSQANPPDDKTRTLTFLLVRSAVVR